MGVEENTESPLRRFLHSSGLSSCWVWTRTVSLEELLTFWIYFEGRSDRIF